jgi:hypothetical protein
LATSLIRLAERVLERALAIRVSNATR